jgi:hypothetical protein
MGALVVLTVVLFTVAGAIRQLRENRRRGIAFDTPKFVATLAASLLVAALAIAGLVWGMKTNQPMTGLVLACWAFTVGMTWLVAEINLRWPPPAGTPYLRIARRTALTLTVVFTLAAGAAIAAASRA